MNTLFVTSAGIARASLIIYEAKEGDLSITIEQDGFAEEVDPLLYGYLTLEHKQDTTRTGLVWDETRYLTFIGGDPLPDAIVWHLQQAGFTLPVGYV